MAVTTQQIGPYNFGYGAGSSWSWDTQHTADANTIALYHMADAAGGAVDSSGNGYNLSEQEDGANLTYQQAGKFVYSIKGGGGDYLTTNAAGFMTALGNAVDNTFTMETWIKVDAVSTDKFLICFGDSGSSSNVRFATKQSSGNKWDSYFAPADSTSNIAGTQDAVNFVHLAMTVDQGANEVKVYENGIQVGATRNPSTTTPSEDNLNVFCYWTGAGYDFSGYICELAFSNKVRY